jgi:hypothetical protein
MGMETLPILLADDRVDTSQLLYPLHDAAQKGSRVLFADGRFCCTEKNWAGMTPIEVLHTLLFSVLTRGDTGKSQRF